LYTTEHFQQHWNHLSKMRKKRCVNNDWQILSFFYFVPEHQQKPSIFLLSSVNFSAKDKKESSQGHIQRRAGNVEDLFEPPWRGFPFQSGSDLALAISCPVTLWLVALKLQRLFIRHSEDKAPNINKLMVFSISIQNKL
jgi:hypothetical protein